jgi:HK97 family phage major capsid protein
MARNVLDLWMREEQGSEVIRRLAQVSVAETLLRSVPMSGILKSEPRMVDMDVAVVAKGAAYTEDAGANDEINLTAVKFGRALRIAEEDIDDEVADILTNKKVGWVTSFGIALDNSVFAVNAAANGSTVPFTSIYKALRTTNAATGYTADANWAKSAGVVTYDMISDLASKVEGAGYDDGSRDMFVGHPSLKGIIRKIKDTTGEPIFTPSPRVGDPDTVFGYPIKFTNGAVVTLTAQSTQAAVAGGGANGVAGNALLFFGNPDFAIVGKRSGPESVVIDGRSGLSALTDETILKVRARRAFGLAHEKAWAVLEVTNV